MATFWAAVAAIAAAAAIVPAVFALVLARNANRIATKVEHDRLQPILQFSVVGSLGGGGYELKMTADRAVDSVAVSLVRGFDQRTDDTVMGVANGAVPGPVGTMSTQVTTPAVPAGSAHQLSLWTSNYERAEGAQVRLSSRIRHEGKVWESVLDTVTLPQWSQS